MNHRHSPISFDQPPAEKSLRLALDCMRRVLDRPDPEGWNTLLLYGPSGSGKTRLLEAGAERMRQLHPEQKVIFIRFDQFFAELTLATWKGLQVPFRESFQDADVVLFDDVHRLAGKEISQETFFFLFDALLEGGKRIILTSDRRPEELPLFEERVICQLSGCICHALAAREQREATVWSM